MNKKILFSMFAAISMLFVTSCTTDEPTADITNVRFALSKPQATKALSDGVGADLLVVAVYNSNGEEISHLRIEKDAFAGNTLTETVEFNLVKGQTYSIAFWAQTKDCGAYDYTDLRDIKVIDYATVAANNEARDAFFGQVLDYTVTDAATTVTLKRPFAQLNFLVAEDDYTAAEAQGVAIAQSKVLVKELAAGFNALTGDVTGTAAADVEFALANIPTETVQLDVDGDGTPENYKHLSMNYVLANGATSAISDVTFTLTSAGSDIEIFSANTPLQRNWRTNVIGSLLDPATFTVEIAPAYDGEYNDYKVTTVGSDLSDAADAATDANVDEVVLTGDITGAANASSGYGKAGIQHTNGATIDGNGQTLNVTGANGTWDCAISTQGGTIKNLNIVGAFRGVFIGKQNSKVIVDNCTITPVVYTVNADAGNGDGLEVKNSTLNGWTSYAATIGFATFDNCHFGSNGSYAVLRPYCNTTITNCTFSEDFTYYGDGAKDKGVTVTLKNCKIGDTLITAENLATLFNAGSENLETIVVVND